MKTPSERNSRLNKTAKTDNFFVTRDIKFTLTSIGARSSDFGLQKKFIWESENIRDTAPGKQNPYYLA
jgi:hypothetical protein